MPTYTSERLLDRLHAHTESFLDKAVREWQVMPHSVFALQPAPGSWSANQCLAHLNEYGRYYLPAIEKAIRKATGKSGSTKVDFHSGWLGNYFTEMMLVKTDGKPKKKMSAPRSYSPGNQAGSYAVIAEFIEQQEKMLSLLTQAKQVDLGRIRVPISIATFVKLKLGDVFLFLVAHNYRHILQADRALGNPSSSLAFFSPAGIRA